jgi:thiamine biosynthesis lipoprotein
MGCPWTIQAYVPLWRSSEEVERLIRLAFAEVSRIESLMTDFRDSPFNEINRMAGIQPVKVCQEIMNVVTIAMSFSRDSDGAFDLSYASLGHLWRDAMRRGIPLSYEVIQRAKTFVNYRKIEIDKERDTIFLPSPEMRIGLGGIGKGYAVDRAYEFLRKCGLENFFVNGAGDIRVHSNESAPRPWKIGVRNPFAARDVALGFVEVRNGAVATSGDYERCFRHEGQKFHHVLDGRSGEITQAISSVTLFAKSAVTADVCATTAMVLGPIEGIAFLNRRRDVSGFLVDQEGKIYKTSTLKTQGVTHAAA